MKKVRISLIGVGNIARLHALGYANAPNTDLYTVGDINEERVRGRAAEWEATKAHTDYRKLLDDPEIDVVEIITPHHLHASI